MKETINTILFFFLALLVIAVSRGLGSPETLRAESDQARAVLARPVLRLAASGASQPPATNYLRRNTEAPAPQILTNIAIIKSIDGGTTFLSRSSSERRPIASITKLITAAIVLDRADLNERVRVSLEAIQTEGNSGKLSLDEIVPVELLLNAMLLESSNDAATALAGYVGGDVQTFVRMMNDNMDYLNLSDTHFADPAGLRDEASFSTAEDLVKIISHLRSLPRYRPIWEILKKEQATFASVDGKTRTFRNNNPFIKERSDVVGGKTGYTDGAGESMVMVVQSPDNEMEIVYIVLGSSDRFRDMETLIDWVKIAFEWEK